MDDFVFITNNYPIRSHITTSRFTPYNNCR